ncbi:hypothetical protein FGO68_gene17732 [Halteria grandinella]|uniref:Uncharacterized protein n=1 Tax=Halteria grandinella TaxID=5974 RepID=A0A8J8P5Z8_HALGN|nr:hypothetical protein FGO68_gene17732 [Halteria grandinella]
MDIKVIDKNQETTAEESKHEGDDHEMSQLDDENDHKQIQMDIGVGLYDVHNEQFDESTFKPGKPIEPIIRVQGMNAPDQDDDSSSDEGSDDSGLYYQFDSDEEIDKASLTTKAMSSKQGQQQQKRPMIIDITPQQQTQAAAVLVEKANKNKRKRKAK